MPEQQNTINVPQFRAPDATAAVKSFIDRLVSVFITIAQQNPALLKHILMKTQQGSRPDQTTQQTAQQNIISEMSKSGSLHTKIANFLSGIINNANNENSIYNFNDNINIPIPSNKQPPIGGLASGDWTTKGNIRKKSPPNLNVSFPGLRFPLKNTRKINVKQTKQAKIIKLADDDVGEIIENYRNNLYRKTINEFYFILAGLRSAEDLSRESRSPAYLPFSEITLNELNRRRPIKKVLEELEAVIPKEILLELKNKNPILYSQLVATQRLAPFLNPENANITDPMYHLAKMFFSVQQVEYNQKSPNNLLYVVRANPGLIPVNILGKRRIQDFVNKTHEDIGELDFATVFREFEEATATGLNDQIGWLRSPFVAIRKTFHRLYPNTPGFRSNSNYDRSLDYSILADLRHDTKYQLISYDNNTITCEAYTIANGKYYPLARVRFQLIEATSPDGRKLYALAPISKTPTRLVPIEKTPNPQTDITKFILSTPTVEQIQRFHQIVQNLEGQANSLQAAQSYYPNAQALNRAQATLEQVKKHPLYPYYGAQFKPAEFNFEGKQPKEVVEALNKTLAAPPPKTEDKPRTEIQRQQNGAQRQETNDLGIRIENFLNNRKNDAKTQEDLKLFRYLMTYYALANGVNQADARKIKNGELELNDISRIMQTIRQNAQKSDIFKNDEAGFKAFMNYIQASLLLSLNDKSLDNLAIQAAELRKNPQNPHLPALLLLDLAASTAQAIPQQHRKQLSALDPILGYSLPPVKRQVDEEIPQSSQEFLKAMKANPYLQHFSNYNLWNDFGNKLQLQRSVQHQHKPAEPRKPADIPQRREERSQPVESSKPVQVQPSDDFRVPSRRGQRIISPPQQPQQSEQETISQEVPTVSNQIAFTNRAFQPRTLLPFETIIPTGVHKPYNLSETIADNLYNSIKTAANIAKINNLIAAELAGYIKLAAIVSDLAQALSASTVHQAKYPAPKNQELLTQEKPTADIETPEVSEDENQQKPQENDQMKKEEAKPAVNQEKQPENNQVNTQKTQALFMPGQQRFTPLKLFSPGQQQLFTLSRPFSIDLTYSNFA